MIALIGANEDGIQKRGIRKEPRDQGKENRGQERSRRTGHGKKGDRKRAKRRGMEKKGKGKRAKRRGTEKNGHKSSAVDLNFCFLFRSGVGSGFRINFGSALFMKNALELT
jgi:hypothetical protein